MFNETPEYLKQEEEKYAEYVAKIQHKYGKDYGLFNEIDYDDSDCDLEALIQYIKNKNGETTEKMELYKGEACVCPCDNYSGNSIDVCLKVTDTNLEIRNDIKLIFGIFFDTDDVNTFPYAREVCHGTYKDFRTAILASDMKDKYEFLYFFDFAMGENLLVPYGCHNSSMFIQYSIDFNRLKCV